MKIILNIFMILFCLHHVQAQNHEASIENSSWDTSWKASDTLYKVLVQRKYNPKAETGIVTLNLWRIERNDQVMLWSYKDSLFCDWQDVVVYLDFKKILIEDLDSNKHNDIILVYTLDCTTDISPISRYLVYYNLSSNDTIQIRGWTLDPASPILIPENDLIFISEKDGDKYNPTLTAGRIEYSAKLEKLPKSLKLKIYQIWMKANLLDKNSG